MGPMQQEDSPWHAIIQLFLTLPWLPSVEGGWPNDPFVQPETIGKEPEKSVHFWALAEERNGNGHPVGDVGIHGQHVGSLRKASQHHVPSAHEVLR